MVAGARKPVHSVPEIFHLIEGFTWPRERAAVAASAGLPKAGTEAAAKQPQSREFPALLAETIYAPGLHETLQVMVTLVPVFYRHVPCAAFILCNADSKTQELVARRLVASMADVAAPTESILVHRQRSNHEAITVITVNWLDRIAIRRVLLGLMDADPVIQRLVLSSSMIEQRRQYDRKTLLEFLSEGGSVERHIRGPAKMTWRFSDFGIRERVSVGRGVQFDFVFDDPCTEVVGMAERAYRETSPCFARESGRPLLTPLINDGSTGPSSDFQNTESMWSASQPIFGLRGAWNTPRCRQAVAVICAAICGIEAGDGLWQAGSAAAGSASRPRQQLGAGSAVRSQLLAGMAAPAPAPAAQVVFMSDDGLAMPAGAIVRVVQTGSRGVR